MRIRDKKHLHNLCLGLIHSLVILIPFGMALFTGAYAVFNKNAKDSYTGQNTQYYENVDANSNITSLETYYFIFKITNLNPNNFDGRTYQFNNVVQIQPASYANYLTPSCSIRFYNDGTNKLAITSSSNATAYVNLVTTNLEFTCNFANDVNVYSTNFVNTLYTLEYNQNAMLDNAFQYGFQKTNDSFEQVNYSILDFDALELFDIDYSNNVYLTFVNHYIKYLLNMELVLFIPEILLIFFTLIRRLMLSLVDKTDERSY